MPSKRNALKAPTSVPLNARPISHSVASGCLATYARTLAGSNFFQLPQLAFGASAPALTSVK